MKSLKKYRVLLALILVIILTLSGCGSSISPSKNANSSSTSSESRKSALKVHYIDVGQGDSILIQVNGKNLLIDAGTNASENKVISYLDKQKVKKLDYIVATHPHEDHIGSMDAVIKKYDIGEIYAPKKTSTTKTYENMVNAIKSKKLKITAAKAGLTLDLGKDVRCEMFSPISDIYENDNNYSVVIKITFGNTSFLFTGDAEKLNEKEMLSKNYNLSADVLKLGHHGSHSSSSKEFLDKVNPKIAIISCGKDNDYGHPHKETMTELKKRNLKVYRTDIDGDIILTSDGKNITK